MGAPKTDEDKFELARVDPAEFKVGERVPCTLYVFMATEEKYLPLVTTGEILTEHKFINIGKLKGSNLFVKNDPRRALSAFDRSLDELLDKSALAIASVPKDKIFTGDAMGPDMQLVLQQVFKDLLALPPVTRSEDVSRVLQTMSNKIIDELLGDSRDSRKKFLAQLQQIHLMNDAASIATLALLYAYANDFTSKTSTKMLAMAALFCESGLSDLEKHWYEMYYRERAMLPSHVAEKIKLHPLKSQQIVGYTNLGTDVLSQMILSHHELYNGTGYHRAVQTVTLPAIVQIFCLAADTFQRLKEIEYSGRTISLAELFRSMDESTVEPLKRRHAQKWVKGLYTYLGIK